MLGNPKYDIIRLDSGQIEYIKFGSGKNTLVLIAGLGIQVGLKGSAYPMAFMFREFSKNYTVYVFERILEIPEGYRIKDMSDDIATALKRLEIRKADVVGVSQGGMIAQHLALEYPELVNKLVLAFTAPRAMDHLTEIIKHALRMLEKGQYKEVIRFFMPTFFSETYEKRHRLLLSILMRFTKIKDPVRLMRNAESILHFDLREALKDLSCPTFIISAEKDRLVGHAGSVELQAILQCDMHTYPDYGHLAFMEAKDFKKILYDFLKPA
jgi:pimeloyl-ACP methyl ester carboxylesterase